MLHIISICSSVIPILIKMARTFLYFSRILLNIITEIFSWLRSAYKIPFDKNIMKNCLLYQFAFTHITLNLIKCQQLMCFSAYSIYINIYNVYVYVYYLLCTWIKYELVIIIHKSELLRHINLKSEVIYIDIFIELVCKWLVTRDLKFAVLFWVLRVSHSRHLVG